LHKNSVYIHLYAKLLSTTNPFVLNCLSVFVCVFLSMCVCVYVCVCVCVHTRDINMDGLMMVNGVCAHTPVWVLLCCISNTKYLQCS